MTDTFDYRHLRAMKVRTKARHKILPLDLPVGAVIYVDRTKYLVMDVPGLVPVTGTATVESYSEDNQHQTLYLNARKPVTVIGHRPERSPA